MSNNKSRHLDFIEEIKTALKVGGRKGYVYLQGDRVHEVTWMDDCEQKRCVLIMWREHLDQAYFQERIEGNDDHYGETLAIGELSPLTHEQVQRLLFEIRGIHNRRRVTSTQDFEFFVQDWIRAWAKAHPGVKAEPPSDPGVVGYAMRRHYGGAVGALDLRWNDEPWYTIWFDPVACVGRCMKTPVAGATPGPVLELTTNAQRQLLTGGHRPEEPVPAPPKALDKHQMIGWLVDWSDMVVTGRRTCKGCLREDYPVFELLWTDCNGAKREVWVWWDEEENQAMYHEDPNAQPRVTNPDILTDAQAQRILGAGRSSKADRAETAELLAECETEAERIKAAWGKLPADMPETWADLPNVEEIAAQAEARAWVEELNAAQPPDPPAQRGVFIPIDIDPDEPICPMVLEIAERVLAPMLTTLHVKNTAYGDSAREPLHIFTRPEELPDGLLLRAQIDHKLSRLGRGKKTERVPEDTLTDLLGYLLIYMSERRKP